MIADVAVIGAGFAGSEAAWQLARRGLRVDLYEMRPTRMTEAHRSADAAELVCSNSFKSTNLANAHGLLKAECRAQGSLILAGAALHAVPAGQALAVDREAFSRWVTAALEAEPGITLRREEVTDPAALLARHRAVILASGPLSSPALTDALGQWIGQDTLYFYDAIAPMVSAESIDRSIAFAASRYGKGTDDYLNLPLSEAEYRAFVAAILAAEKVAFHDFESLRPFEGCLPIEVMAERGEMTLAFGPMKPVGLVDPRTGRTPFAAVQLRQENAAGTLYSLVGFQTKMTWPEQRRIFRTLPGLAGAEFERLGSLHRNTFINGPRLLNEDLALRAEPRLHLAGQITGVEGYIESTAMGLYAGKRVAFALLGQEQPRPSGATMTGALVRYVTASPPERFCPMNAAFGLLDELTREAWPLVNGKARKPGKRERKELHAQRALAEMEALEAREGLPPAAAPGPALVGAQP